MTPDKTYQVLIKELSWQLIPNKLKQPRMVVLFKSMATPFERLYQTFRRFRKDKLYQLAITPQKCFLEKMLNDRFDFTERRIYIDDAKDQAPFYIFRRDELKPRYLYTRGEGRPKYIYTRGESGVIKDDFIVFVAMPIVFDVAEMSSLLKLYKLAGTKFKIQRL